MTKTDENYASHVDCYELSQLHQQQPVNAVLRPTFIQKLDINY